MHSAARTDTKQRSALSGVRRSMLNLRLRTEHYSNKSELARTSWDLKTGETIPSIVTCTNSRGSVRSVFPVSDPAAVLNFTQGLSIKVIMYNVTCTNSLSNIEDDSFPFPGPIGSPTYRIPVRLT